LWIWTLHKQIERVVDAISATPEGTAQEIRNLEEDEIMTLNENRS
jgi:hypothetical protein